MENLYAGIDEVGVSSIAGPLVAAVVILPKNHNIIGLKDSKKMSESQIKKISEQIKQKALFYFIKEVDNNIVDEIGVDRSIKRVWNKCAKETLKYIKTNNLKNIEIIVDGKYKIPILKKNKLHKAIIKADESYANVSAASIIAKDYCDEKMREIHKIYPEYNFKQHKGYATEGHRKVIEKIGICRYHRIKMSKKALVEGNFFYNKKNKKLMDEFDEYEIDIKSFRKMLKILFSIYNKYPNMYNSFQSEFVVNNYYRYLINKSTYFKEPSPKVLFHTKQIYVDILKTGYKKYYKERNKIELKNRKEKKIFNKLKSFIDIYFKEKYNLIDRLFYMYEKKELLCFVNYLAVNKEQEVNNTNILKYLNWLNFNKKIKTNEKIKLFKLLKQFNLAYN